MKTKNIVVWFIGSNAVGKTTQAAMLHKLLRKEFGKEDKFVQEEGSKYHVLSPASANVGKFYHPLLFQDKPTTATCGADTVSGKENTVVSFNKAKQAAPIVIIEGIMATGSYIDFICTPESEVFLVLLDCSEDTLFRRLRQRRGKKLNIRPSEVEIKPKTQENLASKLRGFRSLYHRAKVNTPHHFHINTDVLDINEIHAIVSKKFFEILENVQ